MEDVDEDSDEERLARDRLLGVSASAKATLNGQIQGGVQAGGQAHVSGISPVININKS